MSAEKVKFGIRLLDDLGRPRELISLGVLAEELGFDTLWFPQVGFRTNSWVLNAAVAHKTSRIELYIVTLLYTVDPSEMATYAVSLDNVARGRARLTIGAHNFEAMTWVGQDPSDVLQRTREATDIIRRLLRGEQVAYQGEIYRWTEKAYLRMPPDNPNLPILICAVGEEYLELSGEIGDGSYPMVTPPESAGLMVEPIRRGIQRSADPNRPFDMCAFVWMAISDDRDEARAMLSDVVAYFGTYLDPRALAVIGLSPADFQPAHDRIMARDRAGAHAALTPNMLRVGIFGTPEECARQLQVIVDAGFNHVSIGGPLGRNPAEAMRLIAERVIPAFR